MRFLESSVAPWSQHSQGTLMVEALVVVSLQWWNVEPLVVLEVGFSENAGKTG